MIHAVSLPQRERAWRAGGAGGGGDGPDRGGARGPGRPHPGAHTRVMRCLHSCSDNTDTVVVVVVARRPGRPHPGAYTAVMMIRMRYTDAPVVARRPGRPHHTQVLTRQ